MTTQGSTEAMTSEHLPLYIRCSCGARVPWGEFDKHVQVAHSDELLRGIRVGAPKP